MRAHVGGIAGFYRKSDDVVQEFEHRFSGFAPDSQRGDSFNLDELVLSAGKNTTTPPCT